MKSMRFIKVNMYEDTKDLPDPDPVAIFVCGRAYNNVFNGLFKIW